MNVLQYLKNHNFFVRAKLLFKQGLSYKQLALSISLGIILGIIPVFGISTPAVSGLAVYLRLNLPLAIFSTYIVSPLHILLVIPFMKFGASLLKVDYSMINLSLITEAFQDNIFLAFKDLSFYFLYGLLAWALLAIPAAFVLYHLLNFSLRVLGPYFFKAKVL